MLSQIKASFDKETSSSMLSYQLSDSERQQAIIDLTNLLGDDGGLGSVDNKVNEAWDEIKKITGDETLDDSMKEAKTYELRKDIFKYQFEGVTAMDRWLSQYGPERDIQQYTKESDPVPKLETKWKTALSNLPDTISENQNTQQIQSMQKWYEQTESRSFVPSYPRSSWTMA